jgi:hypothetical protein
LLNGIGNVTQFNNGVPAPLEVPAQYTILFDPPQLGVAKRYLLRIINTSFESTFVFSIDNHILEIVEADFVPIKPYSGTSVLVGIGQRSHVIVTAKPQSNETNFWIRTWKANCFRFNQTQASPHYEQTGILRYNSSSQALPSSTAWSDVSLACSDEPYSSLVPVLPWTVGKPANGPSGTVGENFTVEGGNATTFYPLAFFSMGSDQHNPLRVDYGNPTFLNLNNSGPWNPLWVVFPEDHTSKDWVSPQFQCRQLIREASATLAIFPGLLRAH